MTTMAHVTLTVLTVAVITANAQEQFSLRLMGGGTDLAGRVEMFVDGVWGVVCDDDWRYADAAVVCRQLGFGGPIDALGPDQFDIGDGTNVVLQNVACEGSESLLVDCPLKNSSNCNINQDVGVVCSNGTVQPAQYEVRVEETGRFYTVASGHVEVFMDGRWVAVCYDGWDNSDAEVVCRQLGYTGEATAQIEPPSFYGDVLFFDVACSGSESSFQECNMTIDDRSCENEAGVYCRGNNTNLSTEYSVQLWGEEPEGFKNIHSYLAGRVVVFIDEVWERTGYDELTMATATVICRQLGYGWPLSIVKSRAKYRLPYIAHMRCTGSESHLSECSVWTTDNQGSINYAIVICSGINSQQLVLRLEKFSADMFGDPQVYAGGEWWEICTNGWNLADAHVVCRQLDIGEAVQTPNVDTGCCPSKLFDHVSCSGSETNLLECPRSPVEECSTYGLGASVFCSNVRLVGGDSDWSGTVEVYLNGQWHTICGDGWDLSDATVVCRQLGQLRGLGFYRATAYYANARFGQGGGRVVMSEVNCKGTEIRILDCPHSDVFETGCPHSKDAGVECAPPSTQFQSFTVRLSDGPSASQGRVEFYFDDQWYTMCADGWDTAASLAVCRQLGYAGADGYNSSLWYGEGTGRPIGGVKCYGEEEELSECKVIWEGCATTDEASVQCTDQNYTSVLGTVRFPSGPSVTQGRVEVFYDGEWGTVCDEGWSDKDADVICRELGFDDYIGTATDGAYFGPGDGPVFLSNVDCTGDEKRLVYCAHGGWRKANCGHDRDAGVVCTRPSSTDPTEGLSTGAIAGICAAGVSALVGVFAIVLLIKYRYSSSKRPQDSAAPQAASPTVYYTQATDPPRGGCLPPSDESFEVQSSGRPKVLDSDADYEDPLPATTK